MKTKTGIFLLLGYLAALLSPCSLHARQRRDTMAFLTRYKIGSDSSFRIPLTNFCFVKNAGFARGYNNEWVMKWDVAEKANSSLLFMEMNSTDVEGWIGNGDVSGSVQVVFELPGLTDSIVLKSLTEKHKGLHLVNNYGGIEAAGYLNGHLRLTSAGEGIVINCSLNLTTKKPGTKQQLTLGDVLVRQLSFAEYQVLQNKRDSVREADKNMMVEALTHAIIARDSIWEIESERIKDSLSKHPYTGLFRFWASDIDKAGYSRTTFAISNDSIVIKEGPYDFIYLAKNYTRDSIYYRAALTNSQRLLLAQIGQQLLVDTLKTTYTNFCVMDGLIVSFDFEWPGKERDVTMSNFYNEKIETIINFMNMISLKKYHIWYDKKTLLEEQKGCGIGNK